jgi:hypothetical protein
MKPQSPGKKTFKSVHPAPIRMTDSEPNLGG